MGVLVLRVVCAPCGGNRPLLEARETEEIGLRLRLVSRKDSYWPGWERKPGESRRAETPSGMLHTLNSWAKESAVRCRVHGRRPLTPDTLSAALAARGPGPGDPVTLRV